MNLESLKFFYEIAKAGNISTVAKQAHISQSALSQQINRLESDFSGRLLERSNKGVSLTEKGEVVFKFAKNMLRTYDEMINEIDHLNSTEPIIKVEACNSIANYALPCTLVLANKEFPKHHYELKSRASTDIFSDVSNNICDIGFSYQTDKTPSQKDIISIKTGYNKIILVGKNNRTNPDVMPIHKLLKSCLITFTGRNDIDSVINRDLKKLGFEKEHLNCHLEVEEIEGAKTMISRNYGIAFLPYIAVKEELYKKEFKQIEVPDFSMDLEMNLLFKKDHPRQVEEFISWFIKKGTKSFC